MIIIKYLIREVIKNQIAVFIILMIFFLCQKIIKTINLVINGDIPINYLLSLVYITIPEIIQIILPISVFLGLLISLTRLYLKNEIIVMYACGMTKLVLFQISLILALFISIILTINVMWIEPWSLSYQEKIIENAKINPDVSKIIPGKFYEKNDGATVVFINKIIQDHYLCKIFISELHSDFNTFPSIVIASSGYLMHQLNGTQIITLNKGIRFDQSLKFNDFRVIFFQNYRANIGYKSVKLNIYNPENMDIKELWKNINNSDVCAELNWRFSLIFIIFVMSLLVIPFSVISSLQNQILSILFTILLYLVFILLQTLVKSNGSIGEINTIFWAWLINILYLILAIFLNINDTVLIRRIYISYKNKIV